MNKIFMVDFVLLQRSMRLLMILNVRVPISCLQRKPEVPGNNDLLFASLFACWGHLPSCPIGKVQSMQ
jgi:hypothetical protein